MALVFCLELNLTGKLDKNVSSWVRGALAKEKINFYRKTAASEGGIPGANAPKNA